MRIAKCIYSYKDDFPEHLGITTVQESKTSLPKREEKHPGTRHKTEPVPHDGYDIE